MMYVEISINNEKIVSYNIINYPNSIEKINYQKLSKKGKIYL